MLRPYPRPDPVLTVRLQPFWDIPCHINRYRRALAVSVRDRGSLTLQLPDAYADDAPAAPRSGGKSSAPRCRGLATSSAAGAATGPCHSPEWWSGRHDRRCAERTPLAVRRAAHRVYAARSQSGGDADREHG